MLHFLVGLACVGQLTSSAAILAMPVSIAPKMAGIVKGYYALGGSVLGCLYSAFFDGRQIRYVLFLGVMLPIVVPLVGQLFDMLPESLLSFKYEHDHGISSSLLPNFCHCFGMVSIIVIYVILDLLEVDRNVLRAFALTSQCI